MPRVLIAEDNRLQAKVLRDRLTAAGFDVDWAIDGRAALDKVAEQHPDIIVSDIEMPRMTGHQLCRAIKSDPDTRDIPLILLSTLSQAEDIIIGLDCGADNYVTKPYRMEFLIGRMESLLQTPLGDQDPDDEMELDVTLAGKSYKVRSGRQQVLNLLVSTFENAVEKNHELQRSNEDLTIAQQKLDQQNQSLAQINARMQTDLDRAAKIQQSLLPTQIPPGDDFELAWKYIPCDELAGDFLNCFPLGDDHLALFVVDVSGHGVASSLLAVTIARVLTADIGPSSLLGKRAADGTVVPTPPAEVARQLNERFPMEDQGDLYFTMVYAIIDRRDQTMTYASAGHNAIALCRRGESPRLLDAEGFAIGWMQDIEYDQHTIDLQSGDRVYLYSDGVPEALDENLSEFDEPRMLELMRRLELQPVQTAVQTICQAVQHWCRINGPKDDVSVLAVDVR